MASKAFGEFRRQIDDIRRLLEIHAKLGGSGPGRKYRLEVLNKSAIVLITAFWEAYCEDLATEALNHIVDHAKSADAIPKEIKKQVAIELKKDQNEIAVWSLCGENWRALLKSRLNTLRETRDRQFSTPKSANIDNLFKCALGIDTISADWAWRNVKSDAARKKLDKFVNMRNSIAHRGGAPIRCTLRNVRSYFAFIKKIVSKTGGRVYRFSLSICGKPLWQKH